jgi:hypothetical protein
MHPAITLSRTLVIANLGLVSLTGLGLRAPRTTG